MKKTFYLLGFLLLTLCLGGCSKDEKEPYDDALQMLVGKWHSYGPMDEFDGGNHGFTRSETIEGNTVTQEITITSDSRFHWQLIYFFPQVWRGGEFGDYTDTHDIDGRVELDGTKLSFVFDEWYGGVPGRVFTYQFASDGKELILTGLSSGFQPRSYSLVFQRK